MRYLSPLDWSWCDTAPFICRFVSHLIKVRVLICDRSLASHPFLRCPHPPHDFNSLIYILNFDFHPHIHRCLCGNSQGCAMDASCLTSQTEGLTLPRSAPPAKSKPHLAIAAKHPLPLPNKTWAGISQIHMAWVHLYADGTQIHSASPCA